MNQKTLYPASILSTYILSVVNVFVLSILGIQIVLLPVHTGDKRFNQ